MIGIFCDQVLPTETIIIETRVAPGLHIIIGKFATICTVLREAHALNITYSEEQTDCTDTMRTKDTDVTHNLSAL